MINKNFYKNSTREKKSRRDSNLSRKYMISTLWFPGLTSTLNSPQNSKKSRPLSKKVKLIIRKLREKKLSAQGFVIYVKKLGRSNSTNTTRRESPSKFATSAQEQLLLNLFVGAISSKF